VSLGQILDEGMEARFVRHRALSRACKAATRALGLKQVPLHAEMAANTMTAPYYPEGIAATDLLPRVKAAGVVLAGGLHPEIRAEYFRIGHMGPTNLGDVLATVGALEAGLAGCEYAFETGIGVAAAQQAFHAGE
jgi:alanine-glyoxylate transaminase/serine-glyoxylate transaminase/serine-pyruvate transaminase